MAELSPDASTVRVLLVDDEQLMRAGLVLMIDGTDGIEVVGEATDGEAALPQVQRLDPDVVLMDIRMPGMNGIEATRRLQETGAHARVVVLTAFDTDDFLLDALRAGAVSFLLKDSPPQAVTQAVHEAARGTARFSPAVLQRLVRLAARADRGGSDTVSIDHGHDSGAAGTSGTAAGTRGEAPPAARTAPAGSNSSGNAPPDTRTCTDVHPGARTNASPDTHSAPPPATRAASPPAPGPGIVITEREWEVAELVAQGLTNSEIADGLFLSLPTVKTHVGHLFDKLHVTNRVQLAIRVLELEQ